MGLLILIFLALVAGCGLSVQAGVNARLGADTGQPVWATLSSFFLGFLFLLPFTLLPRPAWPALAASGNPALVDVDWWIDRCSLRAQHNRYCSSPGSHRVFFDCDRGPNHHGADSGQLRLARFSPSCDEPNAFCRCSANDRWRYHRSPLLMTVSGNHPQDGSQA